MKIALAFTLGKQKMPTILSVRVKASKQKHRNTSILYDTKVTQVVLFYLRGLYRVLSVG